MYYINTFFLFSILGHLFESIVFVILHLRKKSGFLYLWWTPFYGIGTLITLFIKKSISKYITDKKIQNILLFISFFLTFSLFEYTGGILLEKLYGYAFWNYSNIPLHIGKYISIGTSLLWTIFAFAYLKVIKKQTDKIINRIPKTITILLILVFIIDNIATFYTILTK